MLEVEESYNQVTEALFNYEFINEEHWEAVQTGVCLYTEFLRDKKENPLLNEYLKWKGRNELLSSKRFVDADELLEHIGRDQLDSREKIMELVNSLIIKND